jgi:hypothetical protein
MLQKLKILAICCIPVILLGCAASQAKLTGEPVNLSNIQPSPAKKILFELDVSLENNKMILGYKDSLDEWRQFAENLVEKVKTLGIEADFNIKFEKLGIPEKLPLDATHIVLLIEERGNLYNYNTLIDVFWNASVLQAMPKTESNRTTYKQVSNYKYNFVGWDCFMKPRPDDYTKNCLDAHSNFQIAQLKKAGIIK